MATERMLQQNYPAALQEHRELLALFQTLNEPNEQATAYHQLAMEHKDMKYKKTSFIAQLTL